MGLDFWLRVTRIRVSRVRLTVSIESAMIALEFLTVNDVMLIAAYCHSAENVILPLEH